jgi:hypothetical protein
MPILILLLVAFVLLGFYVWALWTVLFLIFSVAFIPLVVIAAVLAYGFAMVAPLVLLTSKKWQSDRAQGLTTPDEVVAGHVLGERPSGEMAAHGFDSAWPNYFPYQAKRDFKFVALMVKDVCFRFFAMPWRWTAKLWSKSGRIARWLWWVPVIMFMLSTVGVAMTVFAAFSIIAASIFVATLWIVMTATTWIVRLGGFVYGSSERASRRRAGKDLTCPSCYRTTLIPGYKCSGCGRTHRLLQPGPLGIMSRTCACGTKLPTTATRAAAQQLEVVCPYCDAELGTTAGSRPTVLVPVIGHVGVGKTTFFASAVTGMTQIAHASAGTFNPTNSVAQQFSSLVSSVPVLPKTAFAGRPEVMTFEATLGGATHDIQLVDAAGEFFVNWESAQGLTYIDNAACWVFIIDPLTLPEVRDKLETAGVALGSTMVGTGDTGDAYASVVDRFKAAGGNLKSKSLAIVISKADLLVKVPEWSGLGTTPGDVRSLLLENGADNLIRGIELDFSSIGYFAIEAQSRDQLEPNRDPVRVVDWVLTQRRMQLSFLGKLEPVEPTVATPVATSTH